MPIVDFGKSLCLHHHASSLLSSHQWEDTPVLLQQAIIYISSTPAHFQVPTLRE